MIPSSFRTGILILIAGAAPQLRAGTISLSDPGGTPSSNDAVSNFIKEQGGVLTTDLPGVSINPAPATPGTEAWTITFDFNVWQRVSFPDGITEPPSEPGKGNLFDLAPLVANGISWTSDVPIPANATPDPSGSTYDWRTQTGTIVSVTLEDLGDGPPSTVPEAGPTGGLTALLLVGMTRVARFRATSKLAEQEFTSSSQ
jgi:hypothetical protein